MMVLALTAAAAILLVHGYLTESRDEVIAAGVISLVSVAIVVGERIRAYRHRDDVGAIDEAEVTEDAVSEPADAAAASHEDGDKVVFVPGRMVFHRAGCSSVAGKQTSAAERDELELGGMHPCRRCIPEEPPADQGRKLRLA